MKKKKKVNPIHASISLRSFREVLNIVGGQTELAHLLGITPQTINVWLNKFGRVPAERVLQIEKVVRGQVTRYELRPDVYPFD